MSRTPNASQRVYDAVVDLTNTGRRAHRDTIAEVLQLPLAIVDDHLKRLTTNERLKRIERGVYLPIPPSREDRAVTTTMLPSGMCKIEVGDDIMELTMREARMLGALVGGITLQFGALLNR